MPSPFPGIDPYLEAPELWEDVHAALASEIRAQLQPQLIPRDVAVLMPYVVYEDSAITETSVIRPDVAVQQRQIQEAAAMYAVPRASGQAVWRVASGFPRAGTE